MSDYPEHEKVTAVGDDNQTIGDFLEWLFDEQHIVFMRWEPQYEVIQCGAIGTNELAELNRLRRIRHELDNRPPPEVLDCWPNCSWCGGKGVVERIRGEDWEPAEPRGQGSLTERWLAQYFNIDLDKFSAEKDKMLAELRARMEVQATDV